jgi:hypothetical protein
MQANESKPKPKRRRPRYAAEIDLQLHERERARRGESRGITLPADVPVHLRAFRLMEDMEDQDGRTVTRLGGWTVELDAFAFGVKVYMRVGRDGSLRLFCEDKDGREKLVEWSQ